MLFGRCALWLVHSTCNVASGFFWPGSAGFVVFHFSFGAQLLWHVSFWRGGSLSFSLMGDVGSYFHHFAPVN